MAPMIFKCSPRRRFSTQQSACTAGISIAKRKKQYRLPEMCPHCKGWHLSSEIKTH